MGDGLMRERNGKWKGGCGVLEEEYDVVEAYKFAGNNNKGFSPVNVPN